MEIDPENNGPAEEQADSTRRNESFLDSLGFGGERPVDDADSNESEGVVLSSSMDEVELPGANGVSMPRVWGLENLVVRPAARRENFIPATDQRVRPVEAEWEDSRDLGEEIIDASVAFDISPTENEDHEEIPVEYRSEEDPHQRSFAPQPEVQPDVLQLHCPECDGELVLKAEHLGIEGKCVWCELPIIAASSGESGEVRVFPVAREKEAPDREEDFAAHLPAQEEDPIHAEEPEDRDFEVGVPPVFEEIEEVEGEEQPAVEARDFDYPDDSDEELPPHHELEADSFDADLPDYYPEERGDSEDEPPEESYAASLEALDALEEREDRDVIESSAEFTTESAPEEVAKEEEIVDESSETALGFGSLAPATETEEIEEEAAGFNEFPGTGSEDETEESFPQASSFGETPDFADASEEEGGNGFGLAAQAEPVSETPTFGEDADESEPAESFGQIAHAPEEEEGSESDTPAGFSFPVAESSTSEMETSAGFGAIAGETEVESAGGGEADESLEGEEVSVQDLAFLGESEEESLATPGFGPPPTFPEHSEDGDTAAFPPPLEPFEAETEGQPFGGDMGNSAWGFPQKNSDSGEEGNNAFGFLDAPSEAAEESQIESENEPVGEEIPEPETAAGSFEGFSGGFVNADTDEPGEVVEEPAGEPVSDSSFPDVESMWGDQVNEVEAVTENNSDDEEAPLFPEVKSVESPAWEIDSEEEPEESLEEFAASSFDFAGEPTGEPEDSEEVEVSSEVPMEGIFTADPNIDLEEAPEENVPAGVATAVKTKKRGKGKIVFLLIVLGLATGIGVASFLLPVDDYVAMARAFVEEKVGQVSDVQGNPGDAIKVSPENKP